MPAASTNIAFGLLLSGGSGQVWMDDLQFEVVGDETPTTDMSPSQSSEPEPMPQAPANLSFEMF